MDIKIFVSHRVDLNAETIDNSIFVPIKSGIALASGVDTQMQGDNTGDNISDKNASFCELTTQYWAWKNVKADYYGLCHYRRYLNFAGKQYDTDVYGNIRDNAITTDTIEKYGLTENKITTIVQDYDIILPTKVNVSKFSGKAKTLAAQYSAAPNLHKKDLDIMLEVLGVQYPKYLASAKKYLNSKKGYFCNLFIMKKAIYFDYCEWLFNILFEIEKKIDMSTYTVEGYRTLGHLGERLLGIYIAYQVEHNPSLKIKELQPVLFNNPAKQVMTLSAAYMQKSNTIPIVFAANDFFVPMCTTTIFSVLCNSDKNRNYDIVIINKDISARNKNILKNTVKQFQNATLRFFDVVSILDKYVLKAGMHISVETYYRFLIQDILPDYDKVLYLDCDMICEYNIAELYDIDLMDNWVGAVKDPDMIGQVNSDKSYNKYVTDVLHLNDPYSYFQAGVLLLNLSALRKNHSTCQWFTESMQKYKYMDQDILNKNLQGHVKYLDSKWNVLIDCSGQRIEIIKKAPSNVCREYLHSRKNPYIIHYAGFQKPWKDVSCDYFEEFWHYARLTPYYEKLLSMLGDYKQKIERKRGFIEFCKRHCPKFLRPLAYRVKNALKL